ncbi:hypothetical protein SLS62_010387 [Diatrype stigma]|uniref:Phytochrome n=1 Tax=Diatrype stigma TaxID=117547 RepID=A0AAN9YID7_9PEZI
MESSPGPPYHEHEDSDMPADQPSRAPDSSVGPPQDSSRDKQRSYSKSSSASADLSDRVFPIRSVVQVRPSQHNASTSTRGFGASGTVPSQVPDWKDRQRPNETPIEDDDAHIRQSDHVPVSASGELGSPDREDSKKGRYGEKNTLGRPPINQSLFSFTDVASGASDAASESASLLSQRSQIRDSPSRNVPSESDEALVTLRFRHVITDDGHAIITGRDGNLQRCEDEPIHAPGAVQAFGLLVALREEPDGQFLVRCVSENSKRIIGYSPQELFKLGNFTDIFTEQQADNLLDHIDFTHDEDTDIVTSGPDVFSISVRPPRGRTTKLWCAIHVNPVHPDLIICEFELEDDKEYPLRPPDESTPAGPEDTLYQNPTVEELQESTQVGSRPLRVLRSARKRRGEAGAMQVFDIMSQVQEQLTSAPDLEVFLKILVGIAKELTGFHRVMIYQFDAAFNGKVVTELVDPAQTRDLFRGLQFPASDIPKQARELYKLNKVRLLYDRDLQSARLVCRKLINTVPTDKNPSGYIVASSDDLLKLFDANFGVLSVKGETKILGKIEHSQEALAMLEYLRMKNFTSVMTTHDIGQDFPDLHYPPGFLQIGGFLYVPLSVGGNDFIVFFRKGQIREVQWAGNPYDKVVKDGTSEFLEPRSSFKAWHETVLGKCREWSEEQVETAAVLCLVYGKFIKVWRQKEAALQSSRLTKLLLANSAHEVRTPLNAIINCLEIALEGSLDHETRENLTRSHFASKSLIYVINDLLDLTRAEQGGELIKVEILNLSVCIREATDPFRVDAKRRGIDYEVSEHPGLPAYVHGDFRRVRQAISNLTANAMQHTTQGSVKVEAYVSEIQDSRVKVEVVVEDTGRGMSASQLDDLFQDLEQVSTDGDDPLAVDHVEKPREGRTLGLDLAVVARIVRNMDGQLRLKSEEGKGSRFIIQLPFDLPTEEALGRTITEDANKNSIAEPSIASVSRAALPRDPDEKYMLVGSHSTAGEVPSDYTSTEQTGFDETNSISSFKSGASKGSGRSTKSDADRLIDAIQMPLSLGGPDSPSAQPPGYHSKEQYSGTSDSGPSLQVSDTSRSGLKAASKRPEGNRNSDTSTGGIVEVSEKPPMGVYHIADTRTPIKPLRIQDDQLEQPSTSNTTRSSRAMFETLGEPTDDKQKVPITAPIPEPSKLRVLIAEDDPINMKILKKRLEKTGHVVSHAVNGEDCATVYKESPSGVDVILMDMQVRITYSELFTRH